MALIANYGEALSNDALKQVGFNDRREVGDIFNFSDAKFAEDELEDTENPENSRKFFVIVCKDGYNNETRVSLKQIYRSVRSLRGLKGQALLDAIKKLGKKRIVQILETQRTYNASTYTERSFMLEDEK